MLTVRYRDLLMPARVRAADLSAPGRPPAMIADRSQGSPAAGSLRVLAAGRVPAAAQAAQPDRLRIFARAGRLGGPMRLALMLFCAGSRDGSNGIMPDFQ
jgi:hypothetical protein